MRSLVILRGCPGAGKSTWVKENNLEPYTLCPDTIRTMVCGPVFTEENDTELTISQQNETYVWSLLYELLEKRMQNGDFTIIDATHSRSSDFSRYNALCETYRYRKYVVSFTDVPIEVCKQRNLERDAYKRVPEQAIEKMYARFATQNKTSGWVDVPRDDFWKVLGNQLFDFNKYNKVYVIGDIHGCFEPLKEFFIQTTKKDITHLNINEFTLNELLNEDDAYIFVGDYIDRGLQNKEVLEFMYSICKMKNVLCLEGNHEKWFWYYANEQDINIKSTEFIKNTIPQIRDIEPQKLRELYRKLGQMAYMEFKGKNYFITHGGLACLPKYLQLVATKDLINGVGRFTFPVDEKFSLNNADEKLIQIHGHRNMIIDQDKLNENNKQQTSFSLEDRVEYGGNLVIAELSDNIKLLKYKNNLFRELTEEEENKEESLQIARSDLNMNNAVDRLRKNRYIKESKLAENISAFNFTRDAFEKDRWNDETIKARGLFIDTETNKIVARGYEKFFNINEQESSKLFNLKFLFDTYQPVIAYKKYNGFLGILSYYHDELQFHSKSSNVGDYAMIFKDLFYRQFSIQQITHIFNYLKENDVSITFEVIDLDRDPHIIDEKQSRVVLLDIIKNQLDFDRLPYEEVVKLVKSWNFDENYYKQIYCTFKTYRELTEFYEIHKADNNFDDVDIEGVVIECGKFMTKLKFNYYTFWKSMRKVAEQVQGGRGDVKLSWLYNATANYFYKFLKDKQEIIDKEFIQLSEKLGNNVGLGDLRKAKLDYENNKIIIHKRDRRKYYTNTELEPLPIIEINTTKNILDTIADLQKPWNIIALRKEYYDNGGK